MLLRISIAVLLACALVAVLLYSQTRHEPLHVSGYLESDEIRLGSRVGGRVQKVFVEEGQAIRPQDVLVKLEEFDMDEREAQARADFAAREAEHRRLVAGYRKEEKAQAAARVDRLSQKLKALADGPRPEEIEAGRARLRQAQAQFDLTKTNYKRNLDLLERDKGAVSRETFDRSAEELKAAEANKDARQQELFLLEKGTRLEDVAAAKAELAEAEQARQLLENGYRVEEIAQAKAAVDASQAVVEAFGAQRAELEIRSPVAGVVEAIELQPGDLVAAGAPVLSVMDTEKLWVRAYVPENRLGLQVGQKLRVTVDSFPNELFEGTVSFVSRQAEFTPSNVQTPEERSKQVFRIKVQLPANGRLRPGMAADVWLEP